jgi:GNAT superfamily N-acetyltransferase
MAGWRTVRDAIDAKEMRERDAIRGSTDADLKAIHSWLVHEEANGVSDNFLCNWSIIKDCHRDGRLTVYIDGKSGVPVAFQLGGLIHPGILEVRSDMRRRGIGSRLVEYCVHKAIEQEECFLMIECTPQSSVPFWQAMGFTLYGDPTDGKKRAYRVLPKKHVLPAAGTSVDVAISFYPEGRKGGEQLPPYQTWRPMAVVTSGGIANLSERVAFCREIHSPMEDPVIEIVVEGRTRYFDKAKYPEAGSIGVRRCSHGFYIDKIHTVKST